MLKLKLDESMTTIYEKALADAVKELDKVRAEIAELEKKKARLEAMISGINLGLGNEPEERSLTDSIKTILRAAHSFMSADEVSEELGKFVKQLNPVSVSSILSRLAKEKKVKQGKTLKGRTGYIWNYEKENK